jgi:hypothetical protein
LANGFQGVGDGDPFGNGGPAEDVLFKDSVEAFWGDGAVPDAFGIDEEPWTA